MKKKIAATVLGLLMAGATAAYASPVTDFAKGSIEAEFGGTLGSTFHGSGEVDGKANGKSGFKYGVVTGLGNDWAIQYKGGKFESEKFAAVSKTLGPMPANYGKSDLKEFNLVRQINPNLSAAIGWIHNKISYGSTVSDATSSGLHAGLLAHQKMDDKSTLFAGFLAGKNVLFWEAGVSYKLSKDTHFNISYGEREFKNVDLIAPAYNLRKKEDYKLSGISVLFAVKLK